MSSVAEQPEPGDDIIAVLEETTDKLKQDDANTSRERIERRLVMLMREVAAGRISDFFEVTGRDEKGREMYAIVGYDERGMVINKTIPQWKAPRRHCRLKAAP